MEQIIEYKGQRVLLTQQLAFNYGADTERINNNFNRNKDRYTESKHFFLLQGEELREFKASVQIDDNLKFAPFLYLWTKKGAWLHAKSLNTDSAWEAYEALVDDYYEKLEQATLPTNSAIDVALLSPEMQMFKQIWDAQAFKQIEDKRRDEKINQLESGLTTIQETLTRRDDDWRKSMNNMLNSAAYRSGGNYRDLRNESYSVLEERAHCDLNRRLRNMKDRLAESGATKSKIEALSKMDVIESDAKVKEIYTTIVKEISIASLKIAK